MVEQVALLLIGFSICAATIILTASLSIYADSAGGRIARASGRMLIAGLAVLQWMHWGALTNGVDRVGSPAYVILLFVVAPAFYLFFRGALQLHAAERPWHLVFYAPLLVAGWLQPAIAIPLSFLCGAAYAIHLGVLVYRLREQRKRFQIELFALSVFAGIAVAVLALGLALPFLGLRAFVLAYSSMIGIASMLAIHVLLHFPDIAAKAEEAVNTTYAVSTLDRVDCEAASLRLHSLMDDQVFADENLKLSGLAAMMDLSPHQLSELINTRFGVGYPRFIREHRVAAAQRMLIAEPNASVLSVGLAVGFTSQSNFYAAFREITGDVPGRYRNRKEAMTS